MLPLISSLLNPGLCANVEPSSERQIIPCSKFANNVCAGCYLVQYCSKDCQSAHWKKHKKACRSLLIQGTWKPLWHQESRCPAFIDSEGPDVNAPGFGGKYYMWGNMPALDVLRLEENEGFEENGNYALLFAASGDMRNLVKTFAGLPEIYRGTLSATINDREFDIVARNAILLLTALHFKPETATPIMIHLWYSALIPVDMLKLLHDNILPLINDVCTKVKLKQSFSLQAKTWKYGNSSLRLIFEKEKWLRLQKYLNVDERFSAASAQKVRQSVMLAPSRRDYLDRALYTQPPARRVCTMKFREDGILLPFGSSREAFDTPNPTFFREKNTWPMPDNSDPLSGWMIADLNEHALTAKNDIYGSLFFYLRQLFLRFCGIMRNCSVSLQLFQVEAFQLPRLIKSYGSSDPSFDRIEVSNITDRGYLGPALTLSAFGPLLKQRSQNPKATLLALFLNAVHEEEADGIGILALLQSGKFQKEKLARFLPLSTQSLVNRNSYNAEFLRCMQALAMFRDFDEPFNEFMRQCQFDEISVANGLNMKRRNSIVEPWPLRVREKTTKEEFDILHASNHNGSERYVEWESAA